MNRLEVRHQINIGGGSLVKGSEAKMIGFMEGADKRYVIPVYQRKYDWKYENSPIIR